MIPGPYTPHGRREITDIGNFSRTSRAWLVDRYPPAT